MIVLLVASPTVMRSSVFIELRRLARLCVCLIFASWSAIISAGGYTFTTIADTTSGVFASFGDAPAINDNGTVAFRGQLLGLDGGIFIGSGGRITTIVDSKGVFTYEFGRPWINAGGAVAVRATISNFVEAIVTGSGGPVTTVADINGPLNIWFGRTSINTQGTVAFSAELDSGEEGVFTTKGGSISTVADSSGRFDWFGSAPSINDKGTVAFSAKLDNGREGIFTGGRGSVVTITDTSAKFSDFYGVATINNTGAVAFWAELDNGLEGIFTSSGGSVTTVADGSGALNFFGLPSINDDGAVAFWADLEEVFLVEGDIVFGEGIFTGPDPVKDKVIGTGDLLNGRTVRGVVSSRQALNNKGQVAFYAKFSDRDQGIFVATPNDDPEGEGFWRTINGSIHYKGTPVCALVLANGQHMFSCGIDGQFLLNVPPDVNGDITFFAFADGFAPVRLTGKPEEFQNFNLEMSRSSATRELTVVPTVVSSTAGRATISGTIWYGDIPVCALILANGKHMFSCSENQGRFSLDVPLDAQGNVRLFAFASGFPPFKQNF